MYMFQFGLVGTGRRTGFPLRESETCVRRVFTGSRPKPNPKVHDSYVVVSEKTTLPFLL